MKYTEGAFRDWGYACAEELFGTHGYTWAQWDSTLKNCGDNAANHVQEEALAAGAILVKDAIADITLQQV